MQKTWDTDSELVIVSSHYNEDLKWLKKYKTPVIVCGKDGEKESAITSSPTCKTKNSGREASSYIKFIYENYDNLPKYVAFIHGHETAWHQKEDILDILEKREYLNNEYYGLNKQYINDWNSNTPLWDILNTIWPSYFKNELATN
jgi:hypothetical protein